MAWVAADRPPQAAPRRRVGLLALALLGLLGVVALASRGHSPTGGGDTRTVRGDIIFEYFALLVLLWALVVVPFFVYYLWAGRRQTILPQRRKNWMLQVFVLMVVVSVALMAIASYRLLRRGEGAGTGGSTVGRTTETDGTGTGARGPRPADFDWAPVIVMSTLFLGGGAVGAMLLLRDRNRRTPGTAANLGDELASVLDDTLDDLRAERDPRRAVIGAYARMERALAWFGLPRHAFEAPLEYLGRVLREHDASAESVSRLTQLFERAKFSQHAIGPELKDDAIEALVSVRDELRSHR